MRLWLLRHAKSSWGDPALADAERPLSRRGASAAALMRDYLAAEKIRPELVLCSSALRTRETLGHILPALGTELVLRIDPALYGADAARLLEILRGNGSDVASIMLVGHNPAIQELALALAARGERLEELDAKFPTGALAEIELPQDGWAAIAEGSGELSRFVTPRQLETVG